MNNSAEIVSVVLCIGIVGGLLYLLWHFGFFCQLYWELIEPVWMDVRLWIGQVVIDSGCWIIRIGARLSGRYLVHFGMVTPKKLEISYE